MSLTWVARRTRAWRLFVTTVVLAVVMAMVGSLGASASAAGATLTSDQADYAPGATVRLDGAGFAAGELVNVRVDDSAGQIWSYQDQVTADQGGAFTLTFDLPFTFVASYTAVASGQQSLR